MGNFDAYAAIDLAYENAQIAYSEREEAVEREMPAQRKAIIARATAGDKLTLSDLFDNLCSRMDDEVGETLIRATLSCGQLVAGRMLLDLINKGIEDEAENEAIKAVERAEVV